MFANSNLEQENIGRRHGTSVKQQQHSDGVIISVFELSNLEPAANGGVGTAQNSHSSEEEEEGKRKEGKKKKEEEGEEREPEEKMPMAKIVAISQKEEEKKEEEEGETEPFCSKFAAFGLGTAAIHAGIDPKRWDMHQIVPPISLSITYQQPEPGKPVGHEYSRGGNPTRDVLEETIAALEQARYCHVFSSGMSSVAAMANWIPAGGHALLFDDGYMGTQQYFHNICLEKHGLELSFVDLTNLEELKRGLKENTKMVLFETPSNPLLKVVDIEAVVQITKAYNPEIIVVVDNTLLSPFFQRPLALGANAVLHSVTKYLNGHSDVLMGAIATNDKALHEHLAFQQNSGGAVPSSFDAYLCIRGIKTLHLRMGQHMRNAMAIARRLEADERVEKVLYPQLESHPQHAVHIKQTSGMSGMISFFLRGGLEPSRQFLLNLKIFRMAASLGDIVSIADFIPMVMKDGVLPAESDGKAGDNLIRLSVGCEDTKDLIDDLEQALASIQC